MPSVETSDGVLNPWNDRGRPTLMYVLGLSPKKVGALEKFVKHFVTVISERGYNVVLCFDGYVSDEFREYIRSPYVKIEQLENQGNLGLACSWKLWRLLQKYRPKIFVYAFHSALRTFPRLAKLAGAETIFFNDRTSRWVEKVVKPMPAVKGKVARWLTAPLTGGISVSDFVKKASIEERVMKAPITVIRNGVESFPPSPERGRAFREKYGLPMDAEVAVMACWIVNFKGIDVFLKALAPIIKERPNTWAAIVGEGAQLEEYKQLAVDLGIADRTVFTGLVTNPAKAGVFDAADIFCQPSLWHEAFSFAIAEAMSAGAPAIASNIGGIKEFCVDGEVGLLFPAGDVGAMRTCLRTLLDDADLRKRMGAAGRERILKYHRVEHVAERYVDTILAQVPSG